MIKKHTHMAQLHSNKFPQLAPVGKKKKRIKPSMQYLLINTFLIVRQLFGANCSDWLVNETKDKQINK